ncbi:MAG: hypothetical protein NW204_11595 [Xanthomonadaceae bacterium]|nr:hypothetical protein [Xanthomonadaceae bacterium]
MKSSSREANLLALAASAGLLVKVLVLNRFQEKFFGAYQLGVIVEAVLASVVASYVFYLLVVHSKETSDRAVLQPYIEKHSKRVVADCLLQLADISKASGVSLELATVSKEDVVSAFSKVDPYSQAPLLLSDQSNQYANWFQYFIHHENRSKASIRKLLDQLPFLEAKLVSILTAIDDCSHLNTPSVLLSVSVRNPDLSAWAKTFHQYCSMCRDLNSHMGALGFSQAVP